MTKRRRGPAGRRSAPKSNKNKTLATSFKKVHGPWEATEAAVQLQLKQYEEALGLSVIKKSVNQDDPETPHWFWANYDGTRVLPYSSWTLFGWTR